MDKFSPLTPEEKPNWVALILAALVHLLLIGALFLGVQWKSQAPTSVAVEVWRAPPPSVAMKTEPVPQPPPPPPEPKPEPKPVPKVEPTPPVKPDIAIKDDKKKKEEPKNPEPKKEEPRKPEPKKEEAKKPEPRREVPDFQKQLERELKEAQQQKLAQDQLARADAELRQRGQLKAEQEALGRSRGLAAYSDKIRVRIKGNIVLPHAIQGNPEAIFVVTQLPSGEIINVRMKKSSGNRLLDDAIERAIRKSDPLPLPDQPGLFQRDLELKYKPFDE